MGGSHKHLFDDGDDDDEEEEDEKEEENEKEDDDVYMYPVDINPDERVACRASKTSE